MLALRTGWTPDVIAELPTRFHDALHWALFAQAVVGPDGLPSVGPAKPGMTDDQRLARAKQSASVARVRQDLYPAD